MEAVVYGRLNPCGLLHLNCASVKLERNGLRYPNSLNLRMSPYDSSCSAGSSGRFCILEPKPSGWCKGETTVGCLRKIYCHPRNFLAPRQGTLRLVDTRSSQNFREQMKCPCGRATQYSVCYLCSTPVNAYFGSPFGASRKFRSQLDQRMSLRVQNVRTSNIFIRNRKRASLYNIRASSVRADISSDRNREVLDLAGVSSPSFGLLLFHSLRQRRGSPYVCHADSRASGNSSDLPAQNDDSLGKEARSSTSSIQRFFSYVKQVDWMNFIFRWQKDEPLWNVPWTGQTIFQVMVLWFAAFWVMGSWIIPIAAQLCGFRRHTLSFRGQALYSLITDIAEGTVGIWILKRCLARFLPLPEGWFPINLRGRWLLEACWGCLLFPLVNKLSQLNLFLLPLPTPLTTSYVEQSMMSRDPVATLLYAVVISVCAPVWEEVIFRGFLLPSMTRYLPLWGAISVSALAFALAHFSMQRILPLTFLGLVMGFVFVRSRNLLASIVLHSLWNGFAFLELL